MALLVVHLVFSVCLLKSVNCFKRIYNEELISFYQGEDLIPGELEYGDEILIYTTNGTYAMNGIDDKPFLSSTSTLLDYFPRRKYSSGRSSEVELYEYTGFLHIKGKHYYKILTEEANFIYKMDYNPIKKLIYLLSGPTIENNGGFVYFLDLENPSVCNDTVKTEKLKLTNFTKSTIDTFAVNKDNGDMVLFFQNYTRIGLMKNDKYKSKIPILGSRCRQDEVGKTPIINATPSIIDKIVQLHEKEINFIFQLYMNTRNKFSFYKNRCDYVLQNDVVPNATSSLPQLTNIVEKIDEFKIGLVNLFQDEQKANSTSPEVNNKKCQMLQETVNSLQNKLKMINNQLLNTELRVSFDENEELEDFVDFEKAALTPKSRRTYVCVKKTILQNFQMSASNINKNQ